MYSNQVEIWLYRSVNKHFDQLNDSGIYIQFEGAPDKREEHNSWVEVRIDGPSAKVLGPDYYHITLDVDCLLQVNTEDNIYDLPELIGQVRELFTCITVLDDSETDVGALVTEQDDIEVDSFGKIPGTQHARTSVRATFGMYYTVT